MEHEVDVSFLMLILGAFHQLLHGMMFRQGATCDFFLLTYLFIYLYLFLYLYFYVFNYLQIIK